MLKVTKIEITVDKFVKEVEELFPGKFTEAGLRVLFEYIENWENGEYELNKVEKEFEEWTYEEYRNYIAKRFGKTSDTEEERNSITKEELQTFLREEIYEEDLKNSLVGFTDSTIMFTSYYTSHLEYELKKMYERMRTILLEQFCTEFECLPDSIMDVFEGYEDGSFMEYDTSSQVYHLIFRGMTNKEITFEQHCLGTHE